MDEKTFDSVQKIVGLIMTFVMIGAIICFLM